MIARYCENRLEMFPRIAANDAEGLEELAVLLKRCLVAMEETSTTTAIDSPSFIATVAEKLPIESKRKWVTFALKCQRKNQQIAGFQKFAEFVIKQSLKANSVYGKLLFPKASRKGDLNLFKPRERSTRALTSVASGPARHVKINELCLCCKERHKLEECPEFLHMSIKDRKLFVRSLKICFKCLVQGHMMRDCKAKLQCSRRDCTSQNHHTLLHFDRSDVKTIAASDSTSDPTHLETGNCMHAVLPSYNQKQTKQHAAYLDIIPVRVRINDEEVRTYALLDSGANRSFCEKVLFEKFEAPESEQVVCSINTLARETPAEMKTVAMPLTILPLRGEEEIQLSEVLVTDLIPATPNHLPDTKVLEDLEYLEGVELPELEEGTVTILIGNDNVYAHRCLESRFSADPERFPDAVCTPLGWLLKGSALVESPNLLDSDFVFFTNVDSFGDDPVLGEILVNDKGDVWNNPSTMDTDLMNVEKLMSWAQMNKEVSEFGMKYSREDVVAYDLMKRNINYVEGHYELPLPWKNDSIVLPESLQNSERHLQLLKRRLVKDPELCKKYSQQIETYIQKGYAERLPEKDQDVRVRTWYLPHTSVVSPRKPGKVRVVFDCASKSHGYSLNDYLMKGPNLVNSLVGVLLRFRKHPVAVVADIESMFHQVRVAPRDRDALRFLWWPEGDLEAEPKIYRMLVDLFAPNLLLVVLRFA